MDDARAIRMSRPSLSALQQLRAVRALLTPDRAWYEGDFFGAADATGHSCPVCSPDARRWGVLAGLVRVAGEPFEERLIAVEWLGAAVASKPFRVWEQAKGRTQAEVLAAIDAAIAMARDGGRP